MRAALVAVALALTGIAASHGQSDSISGPVLAEAAEHAGKDGKLASETDVTGEWREHKRGPRVHLRKSGDYIHGEREGKDRYTVTYELKRQADGSYRGLAAEEFSCYSDHFCRTETPMQVTAVDADRIEGRVFGVEPPKGLLRGMKYCDTCGKSEEKNAAWREFVWLREIRD